MAKRQLTQKQLDDLWRESLIPKPPENLSDQDRKTFERIAKKVKVIKGKEGWMQDLSKLSEVEKTVIYPLGKSIFPLRPNDDDEFSVLRAGVLNDLIEEAEAGAPISGQDVARSMKAATKGFNQAKNADALKQAPFSAKGAGKGFSKLSKLIELAIDANSGITSNKDLFALLAKDPPKGWKFVSARKITDSFIDLPKADRDDDLKIIGWDAFIKRASAVRRKLGKPIRKR